jgi:hypothetical protein
MPDNEENNVIVYTSDTPVIIPSNPYQEIIQHLEQFEVGDIHEDISQDFECRHCNKVFKNKLGIVYHLNVCEKKQIHDAQMMTDIRNHNVQCKLVISGMSKLLEEKEAQIKELRKQIQEDNRDKTQIIAQQNVIQEKTIDALSYLQQHHKDTPKFEFPAGFLLTDEEMHKYIGMNNIHALMDILKRAFLNNKTIEQVPLWCLDASREKFAIKDDGTWQIDYGGNTIIKSALDPVHDQFLRYILKISQDYVKTNNLQEFNDLQKKVIEMREDKTKKQVIKEACGEFNVKKVFNSLQQTA